MIPVLSTDTDYETEKVDVYHPVGDTDSLTRYPERTGSFEHIIEEEVIPTQIREEHDDELAVLNEDLIRLAYTTGQAENIDDLEQFLNRNLEQMADEGRQKTREKGVEGLENFRDYGFLPFDSGESSNTPLNLSTVTVYDQRQDAIFQAEDKYGGVGGLCQIEVPRECLVNAGSSEGQAGIIGSVPMNFVKKIYVATEDGERSPIIDDLESQSWNVDIESFPEDLSRW